MKKIYCRSCKHSKYDRSRKTGRTFLRCELYEALGLRQTLPTNSREAEECLEYDPERIRNALTTRSTYTHTMKECGIPIEEENNGLLRDETLT